ncbi:hypothetical protein [Streptomyces sp. NPDC001601]|uniref:hypothetical protein n=1 Tax=Streptomyces sp. NPDC001601 TaxID=3364592 RepID=UPI0036CA3738
MKQVAVPFLSDHYRGALPEFDALVDAFPLHRRAHQRKCALLPCPGRSTAAPNCAR